MRMTRERTQTHTPRSPQRRVRPRQPPNEPTGIRVRTLRVITILCARSRRRLYESAARRMHFSKSQIQRGRMGKTRVQRGVFISLRFEFTYYSTPSLCRARIIMCNVRRRCRAATRVLYVL